MRVLNSYALPNAPYLFFKNPSLNLDGKRLQVLIIRNVRIDAFPDDFGSFLSILFTPLFVLGFNIL